MTYNKTFDQKLHDQNDPESRFSVIQYLISKGYSASQNTDQFGIDLIAEKKGKKYYIELERRDNKHWDKAGFKYKTVTIPMRKEKFTNHEFSYIIVRHDFKEIGILSSENVKKYFIPLYSIKKKTEYSNGKNEDFYNIPLSEFKFFLI